MKHREAVRALVRAGAVRVRSSGSHWIFRTAGGRTISVPMKSGSRDLSPNVERDVERALDGLPNTRYPKRTR